MSEVDDLLDQQLDDLDDMPAFKVYPHGAHQALATFSMKKVGDKEVVELAFEYESCMELANEEDTAPEAGDTSSTIFMLDNEYGVGNFKRLALPFQEKLGFKTGREVIENVKGISCAITTSTRADKKDKDKLYLDVKELIVL